MRFLRSILIVFVALVLIGTGLRVWLSPKYVVPIMMYHHVEGSSTPRANYVTPEKFEWHMDYLKKHGYRVISLAELTGRIKAKSPIPHNSVVITFDDGYANNYDQAFPVLKKYGFPATIFAVAGLVGQDGYLTWDQIREMERSGVTVGSHTLDHPYLPELSTEEQRRQIMDSKLLLEQGTGHRIDHFAYPSGGFDESSKALVREAGYQAACTTNRGFDPSNSDLFELNRIRFSDKDNFLPILWMKLSGYYNLFRNPKKPF